MTDHADDNDLGRLSLLASAISHRRLEVAAALPGAPAWTDGKVVFIDERASRRAQLEALTVQAALLAAGSLDREIARALSRRPKLARRYLTVEGHRALAGVEPLLPAPLRALSRPELAAGAESPGASLCIARSARPVDEPPASFGTIHAGRLLVAPGGRDRQLPAGVEVTHAQRAQSELAEEEHSGDEASPDGFSSPVGGGGPLGRWLAKLLAPARGLRGGGDPGADAPTHWTRSGVFGDGRRVLSSARPTAEGGSPARDAERAGMRYPEWDQHARSYRGNWCTVHEVEVEPRPGAAPVALPDRSGVRRSLARLGLGIDRYHRQAQGDDIDIDAAVEAHVDMRTGSAPAETVFIDSVRRRRDLSVLLLLDVSGSAAEPASGGQTVHAQQRIAAALLTLALHELGDRVALYAYHSQGRSSVRLAPLKRFGEGVGARLLERLAGLEPGGYSRLGAAIRHGTAVLRADAGTPRQLLVVLSDGLAYDHGYEPAHGAADARRALIEARARGVGCLCLSVGADTNAEALRRVFGRSAHARLATPEQLTGVIGPLFRSAIRSADLRRRVS